MAVFAIVGLVALIVTGSDYKLTENRDRLDAYELCLKKTNKVKDCRDVIKD